MLNLVHSSDGPISADFRKPVYQAAMSVGGDREYEWMLNRYLIVIPSAILRQIANFLFLSDTTNQMWQLRKCEP